MGGATSDWAYHVHPGGRVPSPPARRGEGLPPAGPAAGGRATLLDL